MDGSPFTKRKVNGTRLFESLPSLSEKLGSSSNNAAAHFVALIPSRFIRQMLANFSELNSKANASKFRERKRKSLSCVHVLDKT